MVKDATSDQVASNSIIQVIPIISIIPVILIISIIPVVPAFRLSLSF
jgi:hypothetical protein